MDDIKEILNEEEESFSRTLDRGERLFDQYVTKAKQSGLKELNGKDVWRLYDTFGFPADLTRLMAEELGLGVNEEEFGEAQARSREASRGSVKKWSSDVVKLDVHDLASLEINDSVPKTDDSFKFRELILRFTHYSSRILTCAHRTWQHQRTYQGNLLRQVFCLLDC